jgi:hypothetical protein
MKLKAILYPLLTAFLLVLVNSSCETKPTINTINGTVYSDVIPWKKSQIIGLEVTLEDKEAVEYMCFHKEGSLSITLGTKGGMCCAPLFEWKLISGRLVIPEYDTLSLVSLSPDVLVVRRKSGSLAKYQVHNR